MSSNNKSNSQNEKVLLKGNEAFAEAAIRGGLRFYFGYPITPQSEIPEFMSRELPKRGGVFLQAESELGAINMAYGAGAAGGAVFISSSSPGIALMQEGMSFLCSAEVPLVALNVSRGGPGIGGIQPGQADYFQTTRGGGNGDYKIPVFAPASIQEAIDLIYEAAELADKWRNPIMIFADGIMGQMMEPVSLPEQRPFIEAGDIRKAKPWAATGYGEDASKRSIVKSLRMQPDELEAHVEKLFEKYARAEKELVRVETRDLDDADIVLVAFGTVARIAREAIDILAERGIKAGLIRPISLWPFPYATFDEIGARTKAVISAELSMGQMLEDVKIGVGKRLPVRLIHRTGGMIPTSLELADSAEKIYIESGGTGFNNILINNTGLQPGRRSGDKEVL
ncbi:MAG: 3-methyl-2-oxobutanoate dehydrogenase subunit VorB [Oscillospiraceae bacterium]|jgi:2-oxoglutarate ferredoxin oxidoreductase subunit alpha|nr:3-methyl-2-oxobutanoate dehydrogenase subunit VorB [Oscillospiraceae bacterium]